MPRFNYLSFKLGLTKFGNRNMEVDQKLNAKNESKNDGLSVNINCMYGKD